jgi:probable F420-dependent oxidoreductase
VPLGAIGLWTFAFRSLEEAELSDTLAEVESLGYGAIWFGGRGESSFDLAHRLLAASSRLTVATGIVSIWALEPATAAGRSQALRDESAGRFLLGLGTSHPEFVNQQTPDAYRRPLSAMATFLDDLDRLDAGHQDARVLAALGPGMLRLSAERAAGAHPYFVPVEHTAAARAALGPGPLLAPELAVVLESDPAVARRAARAYMALYLQLSNYVRNLRRLGFTDDDVSGPSDRLVDAIVAWGDEEAVARRVRAHLDAGADHVCIQVLEETGEMGGVPLDAWRRLAPTLPVLP